MSNATVEVKTAVPVRYLRARLDVRYWDDGQVNGSPDSDESPEMPLQNGGTWDITIDLQTGKIRDWPEGTTASTHYKVCDAGVYQAIAESGEVVAEVDGYVPRMLYPNADGFGDYVILKIDEEGCIADFFCDLSFFSGDD